MQQPESKPGLIPHWPAAMVVLCLTGLVTLLSFRDVLYNAQHKSFWLVDWRFMLPPWPAAAVNLAFYAYFLWVGVAFYRIARGNERVLVAGFFVGILLRPLLSLISLSAAADYIQIVGNVASLVANAIAFVAAVYICKIAARSKP